MKKIWSIFGLKHHTIKFINFKAISRLGYRICRLVDARNKLIDKHLIVEWANMQNWHKKQPIEQEKRQRLDEHFAAHTERFIEMVNQRENVFMMPDQYFFANGGINSNFSKNA